MTEDCVERVTDLLMQVSPKELAELKTNFMELYDDNKDGKIEIREVSSYTVKKVIVFYSVASKL